MAPPESAWTGTKEKGGGSQVREISRFALLAIVTVAAALVGDRPDEGGGIVRDFPLKRIGQILAATADNRGSADVRGQGHRREAC